MGSGVFLAAVVVAWFVVLVPMVLTRRDNALESVIRENDSSSARVLRRTPKPKAAGQRQRSYPMSARETSPSHELDDAVDTHEHDEPHAAYDEPAQPRERGPRRTDAARKRMMQRRRQTLLGLGGFFLFSLALAVFAGTWTWVIAAASGVALAAYLVHLRNETRREEERRLTREIRVNRARTDVTDRSATRSQSSLATNAFVASSITEPEVVSLDDEDPELYDLGDATVADSIDLSGQRHSEYQDSPDYYDWDDDPYDDPRYGIDGAGTDDDKQYPRAV
ncbi:hypothetical protein [Blastococcus sp. Marseille-P5729]|uniref:divisome protein SepX/GlpR n=1 Tax=Blastococcus sp. Marseille-P5729 TaxID=2086582 RepID=UPI000D0FEDBA|nr:hypothetical protein [Blastococcus sp. Marseille-P5729]